MHDREGLRYCSIKEEENLKKKKSTWLAVPSDVTEDKMNIELETFVSDARDTVTKNNLFRQRGSPETHRCCAL